MCHRSEVPGKPRPIGLIQRRLDLVHHAEGRGPDPQNGKVQCDGHQRPLPAGEQADAPLPLSRRLGLDVDAAVQGVSLVFQGQHPLAPAEELGKGLGKGRPDLGKLGAEALVHLLGDGVDDPFQGLPGGLHVVLLVREVLPALFHALKFLHSPQVHVAQGGDVTGGNSQFYFVAALPDSVSSDQQAELAQNGYTDSQVAAYAAVGGLPYLDNTDTVFGQVYQGMDVVDAMACVETTKDEDGNDTWKPTEDAAITIEKVTITTYPGPAAGDEATSDSSVG